jgi:prophage tail gpP-like protein
VPGDSGDRLELYIGQPRGRTLEQGFDYVRFEPDRYAVNLDMLELADDWSASFRFDRDLWRWSAPDNPVIIELNGRAIMTGLIDDCGRAYERSSGSRIELRGRCRGGRLVDESAPLVKFANMTILQLGKAMAGTWFNEVVLQNADNRRLLGGGRGARTSGEPLATAKGKKGKAVGISGRDGKRRVDPGETRSQVLEYWLGEAGLLGWSSADGRQFIIGEPNYEQEPQFSLFAPAPRSARRDEGNVLALKHTESTAERYSRITVLGSGAGSATNYGENVQRRGAALQGPTSTGLGGSFRIPKELIILDEDLHTQRRAQERADNEMKLRESQALTVEVTVHGHSQAMGADAERTNYGCDMMVDFEDEEIAAPGNPRAFLITRVGFDGSRSGRVTRLTLVPRGTELRLST